MAFGSLEISRRALNAQRYALDVTSNNIANVNTEGYSRRQAIISENTPTFNSPNFNGSGAIVDKLRTFREEFFDKEIRSSITRSSTYTADQQILQRIEAIISEPTDNTIGNVLNEFFNKFDELAIKPESEAHRDSVLSIAKTLTDRFNSTSQSLIDTRLQVLNSLNNKVGESNSIIDNIVNLNKGFSANQSLAQNDAQTMVDQRELELEKLSKFGNVNSSLNKDGTINVYLNGINVVTSQIGSKLAVNEATNNITGEKTASIFKVDKDNNVLSKISLESGEIGSLLNHYNVTLDDKDSSGEFSIHSQLNTLSKAVAEKVNSLLQTGYGLDDLTGAPKGRNFFESSDKNNPNISALNITISKDVIGQPRNIALSDKPNEPGNNKIALKVARLNEDTRFLENKKPIEFYNQLIGRIGIRSREADNGVKTSKLINEQLTNQRESIIGVNLDEEAVNIVKFQQAFEAASRSLNAINEIYTTIINLGR